MNQCILQTSTAAPDYTMTRITNGADRRMVQSRRNVLKALISQDLPAHMQVENFIITVCPCYNADHVIVWFVTPEMNENRTISRQNRLEASNISPTNVSNIIIPKHKTKYSRTKTMLYNNANEIHCIMRTA